MKITLLLILLLSPDALAVPLSDPEVNSCLGWSPSSEDVAQRASDCLRSHTRLIPSEGEGYVLDELAKSQKMIDACKIIIPLREIDFSIKTICRKLIFYTLTQK